jgi:hypothetical protein
MIGVTGADAMTSRSKESAPPAPCKASTLYGDCARTRWWKRILHAEIIGQREFFDAHGFFPEDQRAFVERYLSQPKRFAAE